MPSLGDVTSDGNHVLSMIHRDMSYVDFDRIRRTVLATMDAFEQHASGSSDFLSMTSPGREIREVGFDINHAEIQDFLTRVPESFAGALVHVKGKRLVSGSMT